MTYSVLHLRYVALMGCSCAVHHRLSASSTLGTVPTSLSGKVGHWKVCRIMKPLSAVLHATPMSQGNHQRAPPAQPLTLGGATAGAGLALDLHPRDDLHVCTCHDHGDVEALGLPAILQAVACLDPAINAPSPTTKMMKST